MVVQVGICCLTRIRFTQALGEQIENLLLGFYFRFTLRFQLWGHRRAAKVLTCLILFIQPFLPAENLDKSICQGCFERKKKKKKVPRPSQLMADTFILFLITHKSSRFPFEIKINNQNTDATGFFFLPPKQPQTTEAVAGSQEFLLERTAR